MTIPLSDCVGRFASVLFPEPVAPDISAKLEADLRLEAVYTYLNE
jgi:hypothetical protein